MSYYNYLKYITKYEEQDDRVIFHMKDLPSVKNAGAKIVREIYRHLFDDETIQLNQVQKIDELTYFVSKKQYYCLNCEYPIYFNSNNIAMCDRCNWRNELNDDPPGDIEPIIVKRKTFEDYSSHQICFPLIGKKDLTHLPKGLKKAVETWLKEPEKLNKRLRDNILNNLFKKDSKKFEHISKRYSQKAKLVRFFKNTNF